MNYLGWRVTDDCFSFYRNTAIGYLAGYATHYIERENFKCGDCIHFQPAWLCKKARGIGGKNSPVDNCPDFERGNMPNIKITAEVDGKQVPLETVSTETFEAIKALEKPKEIPVARTGNMSGANKRLILRIDNVLRKFITEHKDISMIAINLEDGRIMHWGSMGIYGNIRPL